MTARDDWSSSWWGRGYGGGESEGGAVGGLGAALEFSSHGVPGGGGGGGGVGGLANPHVSASGGAEWRLGSAAARDATMWRSELTGENRRLYLDNMRLWDCLALFRSDPTLTCQGAINAVFSLDDREYLREFPDTQNLLDMQFPGGANRHGGQYDAVSENARLKEENSRLHAAVWVLRDNPTLQADSTVAAIFRLSDAQFQRKFNIVATVDLYPDNLLGMTGRNNNKMKVKATRTHLELGANTSTIHLVKKPIEPRRPERAKSMSGKRRASTIGANHGPVEFPRRKRSESAEPMQDYSTNRKPSTLDEMQDFYYPYKRFHSKNRREDVDIQATSSKKAQPEAKKMGKETTPRRRKSTMTKGVRMACARAGGSRSDTEHRESVTRRDGSRGSQRHLSEELYASKPTKCVSFEEPHSQSSQHRSLSKADVDEDGCGAKETSRRAVKSFRERIQAILDTPMSKTTCSMDDNQGVGFKSSEKKLSEREKERRYGAYHIKEIQKQQRRRSLSLSCAQDSDTSPRKTRGAHRAKSVGRERSAKPRSSNRAGSEVRGHRENRAGKGSSENNEQVAKLCPADLENGSEEVDEYEEDGRGLYLTQCALPERTKTASRRMSHMRREPSKRHTRETKLSPLLDPCDLPHRYHVPVGMGRLLPRAESRDSSPESEPLDRNFNRSPDKSPSDQSLGFKTLIQSSESARKRGTLPRRPGAERAKPTRSGSHDTMSKRPESKDDAAVGNLTAGTSQEAGSEKMSTVDGLRKYLGCDAQQMQQLGEEIPPSLKEKPNLCVHKKDSMNENIPTACLGDDGSNRAKQRFTKHVRFQDVLPTSRSDAVIKEKNENESRVAISSVVTGDPGGPIVKEAVDRNDNKQDGVEPDSSPIPAKTVSISTVSSRERNQGRNLQEDQSMKQNLNTKVTPQFKKGSPSRSPDSGEASSSNLPGAPRLEMDENVIIPIDSRDRSVRPKSASGMREFQAIRQANLKQTAVYHALSANAVGSMTTSGSYVGKFPVFTSSQSLSTAASPPTPTANEGEMPLFRSALRGNAGTKKPSFRLGMTSASSIKKASYDRMSSGTVPGPWTPRSSIAGSQYLEASSGANSRLRGTGPEVYLSQEPAPPRAPRHKPYPHRTYTTVKHFTDRHQRIMPHSASHSVQKNISATFSFSREKSPSMALVLDEDFKRWMAGRVRASIADGLLPQQASETTGAGLRWRHNAVKKHSEGWPRSVKPKNSIYSEVNGDVPLIARQGKLKEADDPKPCIPLEARLNLLKELGGARYCHALEKMIKRDAPCQRWIPYDKKPLKRGGREPNGLQQ